MARIGKQAACPFELETGAQDPQGGVATRSDGQ
jgi:hypothetical protein